MGGMGEDRPSYSPAHPSGRAPQKFFDRCAVTSTEGADPVFSGRGSLRMYDGKTADLLKLFWLRAGGFPR